MGRDHRLDSEGPGSTDPSTCPLLPPLSSPRRRVPSVHPRAGAGRTAPSLRLPMPTPAYRSLHLPASTSLVVSPATGTECTPDWKLSNPWNFQKFSSWVSPRKKIQATSPRTIKAEKSERCLLPPRTRHFSKVCTTLNFGFFYNQTRKSPARRHRDPDSRSRPNRETGDSLFPDSRRIGNRGFPVSRFWPNRESGIPSPIPGQIGSRNRGNAGNWGFQVGPLAHEERNLPRATGSRC